MPRIPRLDRTLVSTIPLARGVADRAIRTALPVVTGVVGRVASHLPWRSGSEPSRPETFTTSTIVDEPTPEPVDAASEPAASKTPSPATVARNVAGPRPTAKSPAKPKPSSVPGAKLPVTRPST